jgi:hypothetical protein
VVGCRMAVIMGHETRYSRWTRSSIAWA